MKTFRYLLISCFGARFAFTLLPVKALRTTAHRSTSKQNAHLGSKQGDRSLADAVANESTFTETACFDQKINAFLKENNIPGAGLAVLKDGKISAFVLHSVYAQGYGYRDVPGIGDPATLRKASQCTPFRLASVSKPVSSLAILRLLQDKKLSLNDKVFGPGGILQSMSDNPKLCCPIKDNRILDVTVYHLLTHTGGWDRDLDVTNADPMFQSSQVASTLGIPGPSDCEDVIFYMFGQALQHVPGAVYAYSNFGYCILGRVIEKITGLQYEEAVRQVLLDPAGVSRDEMYIGSTQLVDIPAGESEYLCPGCPLVGSVFPSEPNPVPVPYGAWHLEAFDAHGGWVASAPQLMQMLSAVSSPHCNGTIAGQNTDKCLLWDTSIDLLTNKPSIYGAGDLSWYGLGFSVSDAGGDQNWWHDGSLDGTSTLMVRTNADYGYAWAVLLNRRGFAGNVDALMWDAVGCVSDKWPSGFKSTCDLPTPADAPPTAPAPAASCFSGNSEVIVKDKGVALMSDLKIGDSVLTADGTFAAVYSFGHRQESTMTEYLQLHLTGSTITADKIETLEISEDHLIYSIPSRETTTMTLVPAGKLRVGAWLVTATGPAEILAIQAVRRPGAYAPLTTSGHLLVNGVAVSSYVSRKWLAPSVVAAGSGNWLHFLQHGAILPWRVFCTVTVFGGCQQEFYDEKTGFSPWVQFWFRVEQWQMSLSKFGQVAFFLLLAAPACLAMLVGKLTVVPLPGDPSWVQYQHIIATLVAVVVLHYLVEKVQSKRRVRSIDHFSSDRGCCCSSAIGESHEGTVMLMED